MTDPSRPDWADIRRRYEETADAAADICRDAGIARSDLDKARKKEQWRRQHPRPFPPPRQADVLAPVSRTKRPRAKPEGGGDPGPSRLSGVPGPAGHRASREALKPDDPDTGSAADTPGSDAVPTPAARRRLLERLVAAISMKLEQLERRITHDLATPDDGTATDHEREIRAIGFLIDNLDKLRELEAGYANPTGKIGAGASATDLADEAERCRRELAERLSRLVDAAATEA